MRSSGILMHLSSLPSDYGIGTMGKAAFEFIDFLEDAGQKNWQILPITPTSYGDSPYQSFSTFAGNPYFIDLDLLCEEGLLKKEEYEKQNFGIDDKKVDYQKIYELRFPLLRKAAQRFYRELPLQQLEDFKRKNKDWLYDYALFMALKSAHNGQSWIHWEDEFRLRKSDAIMQASKKWKDEIDFFIFLQYIFFKQWNKMKSYANKKGIQIIGDLPIYVAMDSADVWANPELFLLDENLNPTVVAGCPPDYFAETGQLWGNPIYQWDYMKKTGYEWWIRRIKAAVSTYDTVRIDHFRGFESFWAVPGKDKTAVNGTWEKGPGMDLFQKVQQLGNVSIIAEDLGLITQPVKDLLKDSGYPGMKVLQFAFTPEIESDYLPHRYDHHCVCYTGTHDNNTLLGWLSELSESERTYVYQYTRSKTDQECIWNLIATAWASPADIAITTMQDLLELSSEARMNTPSISTGNWTWRAERGCFTKQLAKRINDLTKLYWR